MREPPAPNFYLHTRLLKARGVIKPRGFSPDPGNVAAVISSAPFFPVLFQKPAEGEGEEKERRRRREGEGEGGGKEEGKGRK